MNAYQFTLPDASNDGQSYAGARLTWENEALRIAGGFTKLGEVEGAWMDGDRPVWERNHLYQVAVSTHHDYERILTATRRLFPDQLAFYVVTLGTAGVVDGKPPEETSQQKYIRNLKAGAFVEQLRDA